jgi:O-antigen ligase
VSQPERLIRVCRQSSTTLIVCLPFLALFDGSRNLKLQGLLLLVTTLLAIPVLVAMRQLFADTRQGLLVLLYAAFGLLSCVLNPSAIDNLFGPVRSHLGSLILLACVLAGASTLYYQRRTKILWLYAVISLVGYLSVPYSLVRFHSLSRISGLTSQPVVLGCLLAVGLVLGYYIFILHKRHRALILLNQLAVGGLLLATQTRAAIGLALLMLLISYYWFTKPTGLLKTVCIPLVIACLVVISLLYLPGRSHGSNYMIESVRYRLHLAEAAISASADRPFTGYGAANIPVALDCHTLQAADLQKTCRQGFSFNSSHNIFLDRVIEMGWIGGGAYIALVGTCLYRGLRSNREAKVLSLAALLIAFYYLTNITSVTLELLFWILLVSAAFHPRLAK